MNCLQRLECLPIYVVDVLHPPYFPILDVQLWNIGNTIFLFIACSTGLVFCLSTKHPNYSVFEYKKHYYRISCILHGWCIQTHVFLCNIIEWKFMIYVHNFLTHEIYVSYTLQTWISWILYNVIILWNLQIK